MFKSYVVAKYTLFFLFIATVDSLDETRDSEDVLVNRGAVEETVVVFIDDIVVGGSSHLTVKFL